MDPTSDQAATWNVPSKKIDSMASSSSRRISIPRASSALIPLNSRGLWEAVTTTPPFRWPDFARKYCSHGVGTTPRSITSQPADMRTQTTFDERSGGHVHGRPERARGHVRVGGDLRASRVEEDPLRMQVAGERPRLGPVPVVLIRREPAADELREHLPLQRHRV